jgi:hypothetical protein
VLLFNHRLWGEVDDAIFGRTAQAHDVKNKGDFRFLTRVQSDLTFQGPETARVNDSETGAHGI